MSVRVIILNLLNLAYILLETLPEPSTMHTPKAVVCSIILGPGRSRSRTSQMGMRTLAVVAIISENSGNQ